VNVLMIGDVVGSEATAWLAGRLPTLRREHAIDLVVINGENCAVSASTPWAGFGMTRALVDLLLEAGADVITSGNHGWDGPDAEMVHRHPRVLRPLNMPPETMGRGLTTVEVAGEPVTIVNLASERGMIEAALPVYPAWRAVERRGMVLVDFHGDATWEKMIFATAIDGEAAAVVGTHTHEATEALHILPSGTAFVADVGMTGPTGHPGGSPLAHFAAKYRGDDWRALPPFTLATGPITLGAVLLRTEDGKTQSITRIR
jgi:metallophosphoesterase (TIGR00282 family)